jgi:integrase
MDTQLTTTGNVTADVLTAIDRAELAGSTRIKYRRAVEAYLATGASLADSQALASYAQGVSKSARGFLKAAVRLWANDVRLAAQAGSTPDTALAVIATEHRLNALTQAIKIKSDKGTRAHTWLTLADVRRLLATCDSSTITGKRDRLVLGLLTGAGLRREELAGLKWDDVKLQPVKGKFRTVISIRGKGDKARVIPINDKLAEALDQWAGVVGRTGYVVRSLGMNREPGDSISAVAIFNIVRKAGEQIGRPELAAHDLRRTYAQLGYEAGVPITQISKLLGHSSVATTQRYLNLELDLEQTVSDFIPFN